MNELLDKILAGLRKLTPNDNRLDHLESDVWARVVAQKWEQPVGRFEYLLSLIFPAQHRVAPIMCAAMLGVMIGFTTLPTGGNPDAAEMLNFKVFKPKAVALASLTPSYRNL